MILYVTPALAIGDRRRTGHHPQFVYHIPAVPFLAQPGLLWVMLNKLYAVPLANGRNAATRASDWPRRLAGSACGSSDLPVPSKRKIPPYPETAGPQLLVFAAFALDALQRRYTNCRCAAAFDALRPI